MFICLYLFPEKRLLVGKRLHVRLAIILLNKNTFKRKNVYYIRLLTKIMLYVYYVYLTIFSFKKNSY